MLAPGSLRQTHGRTSGGTVPQPRNKPGATQRRSAAAAFQEPVEWPYGLVDDPKSDYFARYLGGAFFQDMKSSKPFLEALEADAMEKNTSGKELMEEMLCRAEAFMKSEKIIDREAFQDLLNKTFVQDGKLTMLLGGKSIGKSLVLRQLVAWKTQKGSNRTILLVNMRYLAGKDLYTAVVETAITKANCGRILGRLLISRTSRPLARLACLVASLAIARWFDALGLLVPVQSALIDIYEAMSLGKKANTLIELVQELRSRGRDTTIIVDESNLALPSDTGGDATAARQALALFTGMTKENSEAAILLVSSEHGFPYKLQKAGLNLLDMQKVIIAPEVPPAFMLNMFREQWGMGERLARLMVATYGGSIAAAETALCALDMQGEQFSPLNIMTVPGIGICMADDSARSHLINIAINGYSPVPNLADEGAKLASEENVAGMVSWEAIRPGLWPSIFEEATKEFVLVASTHHTRLKICRNLLAAGYIIDDNGKLQDNSASSVPARRPWWVVIFDAVVGVGW